MTGMLLFQLTRPQMISCLNVLNIQLNNFSENFNTSLISSQICLFVCLFVFYIITLIGTWSTMTPILQQEEQPLTSNH